MSSNHHTSHAVTDVVSFSALQLCATIGPDHWQRTRPQPIQLSLYFHLAPSYLDASAQSDDVADSLHYGHLAKAVKNRVGAREEKGYPHTRAFIEDVTDAAFQFAGDSATGVVRAVRVVVSLPKQILLAGGFEVELTTSAAEWGVQRSEVPGAGAVSRAGTIVRVTDLVLPVLIGVEPPERLAKQRITTDLTFFETARSSPEGEDSYSKVDYRAVVQAVTTDVESSSHLTLEKLVYEIIRVAFRASNDRPNSERGTPPIEAITVRCRKPSAFLFADGSAVEMTRAKGAFISIW